MNFKKPYDPVICSKAPHGSDVEPQFRLRRDENGNSVYIQVGETNIREYVGSFEVGASLASMLDRCSLMPTRDKIAYLQQNSEGFSVDMTVMPTDGTAAQIMYKQILNTYPDIGRRILAGESFDKILAELFPKADEAAKPTETQKTEVTEDGSK